MLPLEVKRLHQRSGKVGERKEKAKEINAEEWKRERNLFCKTVGEATFVILISHRLPFPLIFPSASFVAHLGYLQRHFDTFPKEFYPKFPFDEIWMKRRRNTFLGLIIM